MAMFLARVELHNADADDYETLHEAMARATFRRLIRGGDGVVYHLPPAEYDIEGDYDIDNVINAATKAAAQTKLKSSVVCCRYDQIRWVGLEPV